MLLVQAYGTPGHRVVANLAWRLVSNETQEIIQDILQQGVSLYTAQIVEICGDNEDACTPLGKVAEWADDMKDPLGDEGPVHSIQTSNTAPKLTDRTEEGLLASPTAYSVNYTVDCPDDLCVLGAIVQFSGDLMDHHDPYDTGAVGDSDGRSWSMPHESLMFLTHLVGDLHQPMHVGRRSDNGGHDIHVDFLGAHNPTNSWGPWLCILPRFLWTLLSCDVSLHVVWDWVIIGKSLEEDFGGSRTAMELDIWDEYIDGNDENKQLWLSCFSDPDSTTSTTEDLKAQVEACVMEWGNESLTLVWGYAIRHVDGTEIRDGDYLGEEYFERNMPVIRRHLAAGAVRLAALLDRLLLTTA